ncbi:MAG: hypothetical protein Q8L14_01390 [Myxococcales bacterium]|nr:hypothetical protein [Myxococcales bacterium]
MKTTSVMAAALAVVVSACAGGSSSSTPEPTLQLLEVQSPGTTFSVRSTVQLEAYGVFSDGSKVRVSPTASWSSSDPSIIDVDQRGLARLVKAGRARLSVQLDGKEGGTSIEVAAATARALEVYPTDLFEAPRGLMPQLRLFANFSDGTRRDVTAEATWLASGPGTWPLAEKGHFRLDEQGDVFVLARFGGLEARKDLRVTPPAVIALRLEPMSAPMRPGQSMPLSAIATFTDGSSRDVTLDARVSSLDSHIARIQGREVQAIAQGRARLVADYAGFTSSRAVIVSALQLVGLTGSMPHADVPSGRTLRFQLFAAFDDGSALEVSDSALWLSADEQLASVALDGTVTARKQGLANISARYGGQQVDFTIGVQAPVLEGVNVTLPQTRLLVGQQASFAVLGRFSDGAVLNLTPVAVLRASPFVSVSTGADLANVVGLSEGPATVEIEVSGYVQVVQLSVTAETIERLTVERLVSELGIAERRVRAFATYSDKVVLDVTELCDWSTSDTAMGLSNAPGSRGEFGQMGTEAEITASMMSFRASFSLSP